jgi:hypothetical protein
MLDSFVKALDQQLSDSVQFRGDVSRRKPGNLGDRGRGFSFEIKEKYLPIKWLQIANQPEQFRERMSAASLCFTVPESGLYIEGFEAHPSGGVSPPSKHMSSSGIVGHPVYPSPQAAKSESQESS